METFSRASTGSASVTPSRLCGTRTVYVPDAASLVTVNAGCLAEGNSPRAPLSGVPKKASTVRPSTSSAHASPMTSAMPTTSVAAAQTAQCTTTRERACARIGCAAKRRGRQRAGNPSWFSAVGDRSVASAFSLADRGGVEQRRRGRPLCSTHVIKKPGSSSSQQRFNGTMEPISNLPSNSPRSSAPRSDYSLYWKGLPGAACRFRRQCGKSDRLSAWVIPGRTYSRPA